MSTPFPLLKDFNEGVVQMMTDGFRTGVDVTVMKHPGEEGGSGPHILNLARSDAGELGGMLQANVPIPVPGGGSLQATLTPDLMVGTKVSVSPSQVRGLRMEVDSAVGVAGVMPVGSVEAKLLRETFTAHAMGSPGGGVIASLATGGENLCCGAALMCGPQGQYGGGMLGATLGRGALSAQLTAAPPGAGLPHELQLSCAGQPAPNTLLALVVEKQYGSRSAARHASYAAVLGYQMPSLGMLCKGLVVAGPVSTGGSFATSKFSVQKGLPVGQLGLSAEVPLVKASEGESVLFGLSLTLGM